MREHAMSSSSQQYSVCACVMNSGPAGAAQNTQKTHRSITGDPPYVLRFVVPCALSLRPFLAAAEAGGRQPSLQDIQLHPNPHSWSRTAHVLYIDSPAGTGFSYTPGESTYHTDDDRTIRDLESFVAGFFQEHAWLREQPLYIAGKLAGAYHVCLSWLPCFGFEYKGC